MSGLSPDHRKFLANRLREAARSQPEIRQLARVLLRIGGCFLVPPPWPDPDVIELIHSGFAMCGPVLLKVRKQNQCHQNVAALWEARRCGIIGIGTGYALSDDGLWRQHSWGVLREGVVESTVPMIKYFGILLQGDRADRFTRSNIVT